jgi:hypothetical protein
MPSMELNPSYTPEPAIDDRFLRDWVEFGMGELNAYLGKHARFAAWCDRRDRAATGSAR